MKIDETKTIKKADGKKYTIRMSRKRYFFPDEWIKFMKYVNNERYYILYVSLVNTGARIMEMLHVKPQDFNFDRGTITLKVTKKRAAKKNYSLGGSRTFFVTDKYLRQIKKYIKDKKIKNDEYIFMDNKKLPENYDQLENKEKKKYFNRYKVNAHNTLKRKLKQALFDDWYNFSLHNIRKTYGNWMKCFIDINELCFRLGHDMQTFMNNYGSANIFDTSDKSKIIRILGDIK
ncbi:MAG: site-specific integrase [Bacillota bacterium]